MKKIFAAISAVMVFTALCAAFYLSRQIDVFGTDVKANATEISFGNTAISGFFPLKEKLGEFPFLKNADLGEFPIYSDEVTELEEAYPNVTFKYKLYKYFGNVSYPADTKEIDLSALEIEGVDEVMDSLADFSSVETVVFGENIITSEERNALKEAYPEIDFIVTATYDIFGKTVREDADTIDLTDTVPDETLAERLSVFSDLKYVDLHGIDFTNEDKYVLVDRYPDVEFGFSAYIAGKEFDSLDEFIDLNWTPVRDLELFERELTLFPRVNKIEMCGSGVSNEDMASLCEKYPDIKFVWRVYMGQWSCRTDAVAFSVLIMNYEHKRLTSRDIEVLKYCPDLEALDLGHQALTDISCIPEYMPKLKVLILADNMITDLSPLSKLKHLHYLEFFVNGVTDLSPLAECKELVDLNISYNYRIKDITPLLDLPLLERLWLEHVSVSNADVELLRQTYPEARIVSVGEGSVDQGWRSHTRYWDMIDMYHKDYISDAFSMYDGLVFTD